MGRFFVASVAVLALSGCDPGLRVELSVVEPSGRPAANLGIRVDCPPKGLADHEDSLDLGRTDTEGRISYAYLGSLHMDCWVHAPDRPSDKVLVADVCEHDNVLHGCLSVRGVLSVPASAPVWAGR